MPAFDNATILITGAASGIGSAAARLLASRGAARLILSDLDEDRLQQVSASLTCETSSLVGEVADETLWTGAELEGLAHAVANAGIAASDSIDRLSLSEWRRVMAVNLDGVFLTLKAAMATMKRGGKGGAIVVTASVAGFKAEPGIAAYAASTAP